MDEPVPLELEVNGERRRVAVPPRLLLVDLVRDHLGLTGTHVGCDDGKCGACTVRLDGATVKSCLVLAHQAAGRSVETVESLGRADRLSVLQQAFRRHHGLQCGYCTPGMLLSAKALLDASPSPTAAEVRTAIAGNLCRCTGYANVVDSVLAAAAALRGEGAIEDEPEPPAGTPAVGRSVPRTQDARLLTGRGRFAADRVPPGTLHCAILRSPHAHARIRRIDTAKARSRAGVVAVITGEDAAAISNPLPATIQIAMRLNRSWAIAKDKVVYEGEPVAAVAATDPYVAEDALAAIEVEYERLPPVGSIDAALAPEAPRLYEDWPDNRCLEWSFSAGEPEKALERSHRRVEARVPHHRYTGAPLEGRVALASYEPADGTLEVTLSTQSPHLARTLLAQTLRIAEAKIKVVVGDVGGGFGVKLQIDAEVIPCLLAIVTGRPVLWVETRTEHFTSAIHSRDYVWEIEGGFDECGRITALRATLAGDCGCDGTNRAAGAGQLLVGAFYLPGNYRVPAYAVAVVGAVTNKAPYGAYRGYGKDIANHGIERFLEIAAGELGMDANELRRRNLIQPGDFPHEILTGPIYDSGDYPRLLEMAEEAIDLGRFRERQARARADGKYLGVGFAMMLEPSGGAVPNCIFNGYETATVRMMPEGDLLLLTGMQDIGQGVETTLAQCVADEFKVAPSAVTVVFGETQAVPYGLGAWSSRGASFGVSAAVGAGRKLATKLLHVAARMLEVAPGAVELDGGGIRVESAPERRLSFRDVGRAFHLWPGPLGIVPEGEQANLEATYSWTNPIARWVPNEVGALSIYTTHPSGCFAAEVEVDVETGQVAVRRIYAAHDCGRVINPRIVEGQLVGGCIQGLGAALGEELRYDAAGRLLNRGFWDYLIPTAPDCPEIEIGHLVSPSPNTLLGSKGMGEGGPIGVPTAIQSAVEDALRPWNVRIDELPLTPERVLGAIDAKR